MIEGDEAIVKGMGISLIEYGVQVERQAVEELLKSFPIESLGKFRKGNDVCYTHAASGVGYRCGMHFDSESVTFKAIPGAYWPDPLAPEED